MKEQERRLYEHLKFLYGQDTVEAVYPRILNRLNEFRAKHPELAASSPDNRLCERDSILITYGDMVQAEGQAPLQTLGSFLQKYIGDAISTVHILPFFPYSSDDGFSVIDYYQVNPAFGDWADVSALGENFRLMFDAVINHVSSQSAWFQGFLRGDPRFQEYFTVVEPGTDLSQVFRPRASPVLTPFQTADGEKLVWTTFSADQVDLNFANPQVLLEVIDILLFFALHGADFIRLDAVTFVWKEIGTRCINSPHTHRIVQTLRTVLDIAAPKVAIITETNVPHKENIAYFGDGTNEAQMVYNFALPLLTLNAFHKGDVRTLTAWASTLNLPSDQATFFNFLACHDGIGIMPVKDILSPDELDQVVERTRKLGGFVSYKSNEDGSQSPYELNINYLDALDDPEQPEQDTGKIARRFLASQSIMLALRGVPGIYFHSLFGSRNWEEGVEQTGRYRTINREKLRLDVLERELADPTSLRHHVFQGFRRMLKARQADPAFHPMSEQKILELDAAIFAILRSSQDGRRQTLCLHNVTSLPQTIAVELKGLPVATGSRFVDALSGQAYATQGNVLSLEITPYQTLWLQASN